MNTIDFKTKKMGFYIVQRRWYHELIEKISAIVKTKRETIKLGEVQLCCDIMCDEFGNIEIARRRIKTEDIKIHSS